MLRFHISTSLVLEDIDRLVIKQQTLPYWELNSLNSASVNPRGTGEAIHVEVFVKKKRNSELLHQFDRIGGWDILNLMVEPSCV